MTRSWSSAEIAKRSSHVRSNVSSHAGWQRSQSERESHCTLSFAQLHICTGDHIMGEFGSKLPLSRFPHRSGGGGRSHGRDVDIPQLLETARILLLPVEVVELCIVQGCCLWWMWKLCKDIMDRRSMPRAANLMVARTCANANLECLDCKI